jgi:hypothetical protein
MKQNRTRVRIVTEKEAAEMKITTVRYVIFTQIFG